jgi:hypothetical protein
MKRQRVHRDGGEQAQTEGMTADGGDDDADDDDHDEEAINS